MGFSAVGLGVDPNIWKIQHNVLHHTYTNIEDADEDIMPRYVMRFSPHQPRKWFHKYQYIYALFFYGISTLTWVGYKDYMKVIQYRNRGLIKPGKPYRKAIFKVIFRKLLYYTLFLVLPMILVPVPFWLILLMFVSMHLVTGVLLSLIFQTAHVMPTSSFIDQEEQEIGQNWLAHQLSTTTNYAMSNRFISWCFGCLNHQVEHHLFPNICHVHYPKIASIVQRTANEFSLPYYAEKSLPSAIMNHFRMLRMLGRPE
jgi:linoleoyl-CoA desaturase